MSEIEYEYGVQVVFHDDGRQETSEHSGGRTGAEVRARMLSRNDSNCLAVAVERLPGPWTVYTGALPRVQDGETIRWGVRRTWPDGHTEDESRNNRVNAERGLRTTAGVEAQLVLRVVPPWTPIGLRAL